MGSTFYISISTLTFRMKNLDGGETIISDSEYSGLMTRYIAPYKQGDDNNVYQSDVTELKFQSTSALNKPYMMTVETIDGLDQIVIYTLDVLIPGSDITGKVLNPKASPNGDNALKRLVGGDIKLLSSGLSWIVKDSNGSVTNEAGVELKNNKFLFLDEEEGKFPNPLVMFRRQDMA